MNPEIEPRTDILRTVETMANIASQRVVEAPEPIKTPVQPEYLPQGDYDIVLNLPDGATPPPSGANAPLTDDQKRNRLIIILSIIGLLLLLLGLWLKFRKK